MDIEMKGISKSFHGVSILKDVSFSLRTGEVHALMGENGAGKSTLMKILTGMYSRDSGEITCDGSGISFKNPKEAEKFGITFIHQELNILPDMTVAENLFLNKEIRYPNTNIVKSKEMNNAAEQQLAKLGLEIKGNTPAGLCSVGQQQMIEISKALMTNAKVLIMDEPTAALTDKEIEILFGVIEKLRDSGVALVYISHRMEEIFRICERITVLRDGETVGTKNISETSFDEIVKMMVGRSIGERFPQRDVKIGKPIFSVKGLSRKGVFNDISFELREGEILGIAGLMGAGRTEIVRAIFGCDKKTGGDIFIDGKKINIPNEMAAISNGMAFVTEDRKTEGLVLSFSIRDNLSLTNLKKISKYGIVDKGHESELASNAIESLKIRAAGSHQLARSLSGGNQQKVVIGKWLAGNPRILIMDEPTRGVDVGAKKEIYRIMNELTAQNTAILFVSSELPELLGLCDRILVIHEGRLAGIIDNKDMFSQENVMTLAAGGAL